MVSERTQGVRILAIIVAWLCLAAATAACDTAPARPRPWRRPEPELPAAPASEGSPQAVAQARADAARKRAHSLRIRLETEPTHLNPLVDPEVDTLRVAEGTIFETLVRWTPSPDAGGLGKLEPGLAESWRILGGGTEIRLVLRENVTFHDGHKFDVVDAQWSLDKARSSSVHAPRAREALADVMSVELVNAREMRLLLRRPNAHVLRALAEIPMLPQHVYAGTDLDRHPRNKAPVGTGPYRLARWDKRERIVLARNETYWGRAAAIDEIEFVIEPDGARAVMRAKRGEIDVVPALAPGYYPDQARAMSPEFEVVRLHPPQLTYAVLNTRRSAFSDPRAREAVALLVDRKKLVDEAMRGLGRSVAGPVWPGGPGDGASPPVPAYDAARAHTLLEQAGWVDENGDGVRERSGERLRVVLLAANDGRADAARELLVAALRKAGFVVEVHTGDPAVLLNRLKNGTFDLALVEWRGRVDDNLAPMLATGGARNWGGYSSKEMDAALAQVAVAWDPAARAAPLAEVARLVVTDWPIVPIVAPDPVSLVHRRVRGVVVRDGWIDLTALSLAAE
jgi:peptide/nickel transport system substrate-binding protein